MPSILCIDGFNTYKTKTYDSVYKFLEKNNHKISKFSYGTNEDITKVYQRLTNTIKKNNYDYCIGHSMGGGLLMRYIYDNPKILITAKIILLMPLIHKTQIFINISNIQISKYLYLPKGLILPSYKLHSQGNIFTDTYNLISVSQISDMYTKIILNDDVLIKFLKKQESVKIIYAKEEAFNTIPQNVLNEISNVIYVNGLHECFNSTDDTKKNFFKKFKSLIV
jgi:hypothetical protein